MIVLAILSTLPKSQADSLRWLNIEHGDKLSHLAAYAILSFLLMHALNNDLENLQWKKSLMIAAFYGLCMEFIQYLFYTDRHFDILDIIANIIGAILGIIIYKKIKIQ